MTRADEMRRRGEELIARADATLAMPRAEGEMWQLPEAEPAKPQPVRAAASAPRQSAPATRAWVNRILDNFTEALGKVVGRERYRTELRLIEIERRLAEMEKSR